MYVHLPGREPRRLMGSPLHEWRGALTRSGLSSHARLRGVDPVAADEPAGRLVLPLGGHARGRDRPVKPTVIKAIAELEACGWIERRVGGGRGNSSAYQAAYPGKGSTPLTESPAETVNGSAGNGQRGLPEDVSSRTKDRTRTREPIQSPIVRHWTEARPPTSARTRQPALHWTPCRLLSVLSCSLQLEHSTRFYAVPRLTTRARSWWPRPSTYSGTASARAPR